MLHASEDSCTSRNTVLSLWGAQQANRVATHSSGGATQACCSDSVCQYSAVHRCCLQVLADFAAERAAVVTRAQAQVTSSSSEVDALRRLLRLKGRELQQLRKLGQEVLLQRCEVEIFLLSSLHQVGSQRAFAGQNTL